MIWIHEYLAVLKDDVNRIVMMILSFQIIVVVVVVVVVTALAEVTAL